MRMLHCVSARFGLGVLAASLSMPAFSAVETVIASYPVLNVGSTVSLTVPQFDPSKGNLTDIVLELFSNDEVDLLVYNFSQRAGTYSGATATLPVTVTLGGLSTTATSQAGPAGGSVAPGSHVTAASQTTTVSSQTHVQPSDFSQYIGAGSQTFDVSVLQTIGTYSGSYSGAKLYFGGTGSFLGPVEVIYTYFPLLGSNYSLVPEPGNTSAGLLALGVCAFAARKRLFQARPYTVRIDSARRLG